MINVNLKNRIPVIVSLLFFMNIFLSSALASEVTVLIYHKFNEQKSPSTSIPTRVFEAQIKFLLEHGYRIISIDRLVNALKQKTPLPDRSVVITIDDGYRSTYTEAFPVLKKYNLPFTVFLYMEGVGRFPAYMTEEQLKDMARYPKVTFGLHSYYHKPLGTIANENFIRKDTIMAQKRFVRLLSRPARYYAYPYGEYNHKVIEVIKRQGIEAAFTQDPFNVTSETNVFTIPRVPMVGSWATLESLKRFLEMETLPVSKFSPSFGLLPQNPPGLFSFRIRSLTNYRDIRFYISELGWLIPEVKPDKALVTIRVKRVLKRRVNRVALEAIDKKTGRKARFFYLIARPHSR